MAPDFLVGHPRYGQWPKEALEDALSDYGVEVTEIPLSPNQLFELLRTAPRRASNPDTVATETFA